MHRSVMQGVDKINAQVADTILSSELDRELNKAIQKFVTTRFQQNNKYGQGFEESQKRRDDLRTLVTEVETNAFFKETLRENTHQDGALYVDSWSLPNNYMYMINASAIIRRLPDCSKISYKLEDQDENLFWVLDFKDFIANNGTTYVDEIWIVTDPDVPWGEQVDPMLIWQNTDYEDVAYPNNQQEVVDSIVSAGGPTMSIFWENLGNAPENWGMNMGWYYNNTPTNLEVFNYPESIIIAINAQSLEDTLAVINMDASLGPVVHAIGRYQNDTVSYAPIQYQQNVGVKRVPSTTSNVREIHACRMVQHDDISKLVGDPFNKTKYSSPLTVMRGNNIDIYSDDLFITDRLKMTYLREPVRVNISEGIGCDLPEHTHEEIVALAVLSILEEISDPRYQTHAMQVDQME